MLAALFSSILIGLTFASRQECFVPGVCINSTLISTVDDSDANSCLRDCQSTPKCKWFSHDQRVKECLLYENCPQLTIEDCKNCISGEVTCPVLMCDLVGMCQGVLLEYHVNYEMEQCLNDCNEADSCTWFSYNHEKTSCFLFVSCDAIDEAQTDTVTGAKGCYIPTPTPIYSKIIVSNGDTNENYEPTNTTEVINLDTIDQATCNDLARVDLGVVGAVGQVMPNGLQILICGGTIDSQNEVATDQCVLVDNVKTQNFTKLSFPRVFAAAVPTRYGFFVTGGIDLNYDDYAFNSTEYLNISDGSLKSGPNLPQRLWAHTLTSINDELVIVIGGSRFGNFELISNDTYLIRLTDNAIADGPSLQVARYLHSSAMITDKVTGLEFVVTCGGYDINIDAASSCEHLSAKDLDEWKYVPPIPHGGLIGHASLTIDGEIYVVGGSADEGYEDRIYKLSLINGTFTWTLLPQRLKIPRAGFVALAAPNSLVDCEYD